MIYIKSGWRDGSEDELSYHGGENSLKHGPKDIEDIPCEPDNNKLHRQSIRWASPKVLNDLRRKYHDPTCNRNWSFVKLVRNYVFTWLMVCYLPTNTTDGCDVEIESLRRWNHDCDPMSRSAAASIWANERWGNTAQRRKYETFPRKIVMTRTFVLPSAATDTITLPRTPANFQSIRTIRKYPSIRKFVVLFGMKIWWSKADATWSKRLGEIFTSCDHYLPLCYPSRYVLVS